MQVQEIKWTAAAGWSSGQSTSPGADLIVFFGARSTLGDGARYRELRSMYPVAKIIGCTTGGQIRNEEIGDDEVVATAMKFETTKVRLARQDASAGSSIACGAAIGRALQAPDLAGVFVLSDGLRVNGSQLVAGITSVIGPRIPLTGGLAGDGAAFERTLVGADCEPAANIVGAIGFYGRDIRIGHGSAGGWDVFGPRRSITRSTLNVLYELDGEPALDLYERYLGEEEARGLPGTGLLFPLKIYDPANTAHTVVRTILAVDREKRSMTFAGDVPEGWGAQLMRGNFEHLVDGASSAARQAIAGRPAAVQGDEVAVLVSCIGRRLLMGQRVLDEVEAVAAELGKATRVLGFYSYGEISPHEVSGVCELHNQTMTITTFAEARAA